MAGAACRQFVGGMFRVDQRCIKLICVAGCAEIALGLDQVHGLVAAVAVVAEQTLARSDAGMRLLDGLTMILVTTVAGFGLRFGQQWVIGRCMEGNVAFAATLIRIRLVGMSHAFGVNQLGVTLGASLGLDDNGFGSARLVGIVAEAAFHVLIAGVGRRGDGRVQFLFVAGAAKFWLGISQNGGIFRTMRDVAEIALLLGDGRMRLHHRAAMIGMAGIACHGDGGHQHLGVGSGVWRMTIRALPVFKGFMRMRHRCIRIRHILPVAVPADLLDSSPQLCWIRIIQIMTRPASAIAKRLVHEVEAVYRGRAQPASAASNGGVGTMKGVGVGVGLGGGGDERQQLPSNRLAPITRQITIRR